MADSPFSSITPRDDGLICARFILAATGTDLTVGGVLIPAGASNGPYVDAIVMAPAAWNALTADQQNAIAQGRYDKQYADFVATQQAQQGS